MKLDRLDIEIVKILTEYKRENTGGIAWRCFLEIVTEGNKTTYDTSKSPSTAKVRGRLKRMLKSEIVVNKKGSYKGQLYWSLSDDQKDIYSKIINL